MEVPPQLPDFHNYCDLTDTNQLLIPHSILSGLMCRFIMLAPQLNVLSCSSQYCSVLLLLNYCPATVSTGEFWTAGGNDLYVEYCYEATTLYVIAWGPSDSVVRLSDECLDLKSQPVLCS